jgi:hypothetical protein
MVVSVAIPDYRLRVRARSFVPRATPIDPFPARHRAAQDPESRASSGLTRVRAISLRPGRLSPFLDAHFRDPITSVVVARLYQSEHGAIFIARAAKFGDDELFEFPFRSSEGAIIRLRGRRPIRTRSSAAAKPADSVAKPGGGCARTDCSDRIAP